MENLAKGAIYLACCIWLLIGLFLTGLGVMGFVNGTATQGGNILQGSLLSIGLGVIVWILTAIVFLAARNADKAWAHWTLLILAILGWLEVILRLLLQRQFAIGELIIFTIPISVLWYLHINR